MVERKQLLEVLESARLAPSVHNSQPWEFELGPGQITIRLNKARSLTDGDPVGRQTFISLGACIEAAVLAASSKGLEANETNTEDAATTVINFRENASTGNKFWATTLQQRFTDRSQFSNRPVSKEILNSITDCGDERVEVVSTSNRKIISHIAQSTGKGIYIALGHPRFRTELANFISTPLNRKKTGISTASLRVSGARKLLEPYLIRSGLFAKKQSAFETHLWESSPAVVLFFTKGDSQDFWVAAGRAYMKSMLIATNNQLRNATSAACVEAADFHTDIEKIMNTKYRLQCVVRVGYGNSLAVNSPRLSVHELISKANR